MGYRHKESFYSVLCGTSTSCRSHPLLDCFLLWCMSSLSLGAQMLSNYSVHHFQYCDAASTFACREYNTQTMKGSMRHTDITRSCSSEFTSGCQIRTSQKRHAHTEKDVGQITLTQNQVAKLDRTLTTKQSIGQVATTLQYHDAALQYYDAICWAGESNFLEP